MIAFRNPGVINVRAMITFGVSSKESANPIGQFGTGMKYAIAICLRHGLRISVQAGAQRYEFRSVREKIRVDEFEIVTMNGEPLGFTTDLGGTWELWQAFRELYCNALDEGGAVEQVDVMPIAAADETVVVVEGEEFDAIYETRHQYFVTDREPIYEDELVQIFEQSAVGGILFYRGVRIGTPPRYALHDYNFKCEIDLTEDRTVKYGFQPTNVIQRVVQGSSDKQLVRDMILADPDSYEGRIDYSDRYRDGDKHGETFLDVVGEVRAEVMDVGMNMTAIDVHKKKRQRSMMPTESIELSVVEQKQLERAARFCRDVLGLAIDEYKLIVVEARDHSFGRADISAGIMYVTREAFAQGTKFVAITLLEEFVHIHHEVADETIEQKWVYLKMIASLGERLAGEPL